jgi:hypothetical protein
MRRFGQLTVVNGVVSTVLATVVWVVTANWILIPVFVVLGGIVVWVGLSMIRQADGG